VTTLNYASLLSSDNVRAWLRVIREGESNQEDDGLQSAYRAMYHPTQRRFYAGNLRGAGHPQAFEPLPDGSGRKSSAFGAYQFVWTTWKAINTKYGLPDDISPYSQDCHAVALIYDVGALDDVIDGRFDEALRKCGSQWASLPNSSLSDGGSKLAYDRAAEVWRRYGGSVPVVISSAPRPAPVEDRSTPARPEDVDRINEQESPMAFPFAFAIPLIQSLIEAFSPVARAKVTKALDKQGMDPTASGAVADSLMGIIKSLAGQGLGVTVGPAGVTPAQPVADPVVAVATVKSDARLLAEAEAQFTDYLDKIAPMVDRIEKLEQGAWQASEDSMDRAAARQVPSAEDWMAKALVSGILVVSGFLIVLVAGVAIAQIVLLTSRTPTTEVWAALTGIIGTTLGILGTVFAFRFGTNRQSSAKDVVIAELSARRN